MILVLAFFGSLIPGIILFLWLRGQKDMRPGYQSFCSRVNDCCYMIDFGGLVHNWLFGLLCTIFYCSGLVHKWWFRMLCTKMFIEADRIFVK